MKTFEKCQLGSDKTALICGISGQDGAYLTQLLLAKGYCVAATSRDAQMNGLDCPCFTATFFRCDDETRGGKWQSEGYLQRVQG